jgi:uncharacterized protein
MPIDHIRYDLLVQEALRGVVRTVLGDVARNGLPGDHHLYVSFDTHAEGVRLSPRMLAQYPKEMTVVLQHQFWDLIVNEDDFEVGLSFGGIPERLAVPFASITGFFDPSVQFGLRFEQGEGVVDGEEHKGNDTTSANDRAGKRPPAEHRSRTPAKITAPASANPASANPAPANPASASSSEPTAPDGASRPETGAEVVRLDRFRKK